MSQTKKDNFITEITLNILVEEHNQLLKNERPDILKVIAWAASNGDRSENADYQYGKRRLREIDRRLRFLNKRINQAKVIDPKLNASDIVKIGAQVKFETEDEEIKTYTILGVDEIDLKKNIISWKSPLAQALLGYKQDDFVTIKTPKRTYEAQILNIDYHYDLQQLLGGSEE